MYYDDPSNAEVGDKYEQFVAAYYATTLGCRVIYQGHSLGESDGGIDLIALSPSATYLIQCKKWSKSSVLHEKYIDQLSGSARTFARRFPTARNIQPVLCATCQFSDDARYAAEANAVTLRNLMFDEISVNGQLILSDGNVMTPFRAIGQRPEHMRPAQDIDAYRQYVRDLIDEVQYPKPLPESELIAIPSNAEPIFRDPEADEINRRLSPKPHIPEKVPFIERIPSPTDPGAAGCMGYICYAAAVIVIGVLLTFLVGFVVFLTSDSGSLPAATATPAPIVTAVPTVTVAPTKDPDALARPENGAYYGYALEYLGSSSRTSSLTITTPDGYDYCIILVSADDPSRRICSVYMRAGHTSTIKVPAEKVLIYDTSAPVGSAWYGNGRYFGSAGTWSTSDEVFDFKRYTWTLTMEKVTDGNWDTEQIDDRDVPFLD